MQLSGSFELFIWTNEETFRSHKLHDIGVSNPYSAFVFHHEGGWANHPKDPGGITNRGITIGTWETHAPSLLGIPGTVDTLRNMTYTQWAKILNHYYRLGTYGGNIKSQPIAEWATELMWCSGGTWDLQRAYNRLNPHQRIGVDGYTGEETTGAINGYTHPQGQEDKSKVKILLMAIYNQRVETLKRIRHPKTGELLYPIFPGWLRRAKEMHELTMKNLN